MGRTICNKIRDQPDLILVCFHTFVQPAFRISQAVSYSEATAHTRSLQPFAKPACLTSRPVLSHKESEEPRSLIIL